MVSLKLQRKLIIFCFLIIPLILIFVFMVYPTLNLVYLSFTRWNGLSPEKIYVGFSNYIKIFTHSPEIWTSLKNNLIYLFAWTLFIPINILIAVLLNSILRGKNFFKAMTFLPYIINGVAISYMFAFFFSPINGGLNGILELIGLGKLSVGWLSDKSVVNFTLAFVSLWKGVGLHIILLLSGLQAIPNEHYEVARIEGASGFQKIWYVIIPGLKRVIEIIIFMNISGCLQIFDIPFIMTGGGPGYASSTFATFSIDQAFKYNDFGMAAAMAIVMMGIIIIVVTIQKKFIRIKG